MKKKLIGKKFSALLLVLAMTFVMFTPASSFAAKHENKSAEKGNDYPIILCHGCNGWGRDENFGSLAFGKQYYWGGNTDFQEVLNQRGFETHTAKVGPLSSNWDRACELYAQIKGGTVDYGEAHSKRYGHERFGRTYKGFCPEWGEENEDGSIKKVHLIGHSQGGQTVRVLTELLGDGCKQEVNASPNNVSELFKGGHSWASSVTTLATPNDGTTLADMPGTNALAGVVLAGVGSGLGNFERIDMIYDIMLDQFGLVRKSGESLKSYVKRCLISSMWTNSKDNCAYDLGTDGAVELNKWVRAQPDTYYFSWSCLGTKENRLSLLDHQIADPVIMGDKGIYNVQWAAQAAFMGSYARRNYSRNIPKIGKEWWPNDGYVNTISEKGPVHGSTDKIIDYNGKPQIGKWNFMGTKNIDHEDIIGRNWVGAKDFFIDMAKMLRSLPQ